jgi:lysophospholipase L1-like esterase
MGDSLGRGTCWACRLKQNPLAVVNLAQGGVTLRQVALQAPEARSFAPANLLIVAGLNDVVLTDRTLEQIAEDYRLLLDQLSPGSRSIVTLIPYTGFGSQSARITEANQAISKLALERGATVIDLNGRLARDGIRRPEYATDGVHFTDAAYRIWAADVSAALRP